MPSFAFTGRTRGGQHDQRRTHRRHRGCRDHGAAARTDHGHPHHARPRRSPNRKRRRRAFSISRESAGLPHISVPALHEAVHLGFAKGRRTGLGETTQFPVLPLIGIRPDLVTSTRTFGKTAANCSSRGLDFHPALVHFGHFVEAVEKQQTTRAAGAAGAWKGLLQEGAVFQAVRRQ